MKVHIAISGEVEVEGDDEKSCDEVKKNVELQWAGICERIEAVLIERVLPLHPGLKISVRTEEEGP
jgi:hypothetical protein